MHLTLALSAREQASLLARQATATRLASGAKWDKSCAKAFNQFIADLDAIASGPKPVKRATRFDLVGLFKELGIPESRPTS